jgi:hypothetical protein
MVGAAQGFSTAREGLGTARSARATPRANPAEAQRPPEQKRKKKKSLLTRLLNKVSWWHARATPFEHVFNQMRGSDAFGGSTRIHGSWH